jgi:hypothetical protein
METKLFLSNKKIHKQIKIILNILKNYNINSNVSLYYSTVHYKKINKTTIEQGYCIHIFNSNKKELLQLWKDFRKELKIQCIYMESKQYKGCMAKIFKNQNINCSQTI